MRQNNKVKAIIFDLGNVLIDFDHRIASRSIAQFSDKKEQEIFELFFDSELTALFEKGEISGLEFFSRVKEILNLRLDYFAFVPVWNEIFFFSENNLKVFELTSKLKNHYRVVILSNVDILHLEYINKTFPILNSLEILSSFNLGVRKPHPLIYQKTVELLGVAAQQIFYTDDRPELVEAARKLGIQGFVYKDVEQLNKDLIESGINIT